MPSWFNDMLASIFINLSLTFNMGIFKWIIILSNVVHFLNIFLLRISTFSLALNLVNICHFSIIFNDPQTPLFLVSENLNPIFIKSRFKIVV